MEIDNQKLEAVVFYVIHNQFKIKQLCSDILSQMKKLLETEPKELHDDIKKECISILKNVIITEISKDLALDVLTISVALDGFDVLEYLK